MTQTMATDRAANRMMLFRATGALALNRLFGVPLTFAISALLAHNLSRSDFAFYGSLNSLSILLVVFAQFGYQTSIVRTLGEHSSQERSGKASSEFLAALSVTLVGALVLASAFLLVGRGWLPGYPGYESLLYFLAAGLLVFKSLNVLGAEALRGLGAVGYASSLGGQGTEGGLFRAAVSIALLIGIMMTTGLTLTAAVGAAMVSSAVCAFIAAALVRRRMGPASSATDVLDSAYSRLPANLVFMMTQALQIASSGSVANIIGANVLDTVKLAGIVAALQVVNLINAPLNLLNGASPSLLIRLKQEGKPQEMEELMRMGASFAFVLATSACVLLALVGPLGFQTLFGQSYRDAYFHFLLLMPGLLANVFAGMAGRAILLLGDVRTHRRVMIIASVITVPMYYICARFLGPYGLSGAISASLILQNVLLAVAARRELGVSTMASASPGYYARAARRMGNKAAGYLK